MGEVVALSPLSPFELAMRRNPQMIMGLLSRRVVVLFDKFYDNSGEEIQREIGRDLLVALTNFYQAKNLREGRNGNAGLVSHPYLDTLRKVLATDGISTIPPLPLEVYAALP